MKFGVYSLMFMLFSASVLCAATTAKAGSATQPVEISCSDFRRNADGSWTPIRKATIVGPRGPFTVEPGEVFRIQLQGTTNYGVKIAETLNDRCR